MFDLKVGEGEKGYEWGKGKVFEASELPFLVGQ